MSYQPRFQISSGLIDGDRLSDLMIEHDVGISTFRTISLKRIDTDYFEDN